MTFLQTINLQVKIKYILFTIAYDTENWYYHVLT